MLPPEYTGSSETEKRYTQYRENRLKISKETADERDNEALAE
jgi:hypothetical protein